MFKSVFVKYLITFTALLLASFLLLLFIVSSVIRNDAIHDERRDMQGVLVACTEQLAELYVVDGGTNFAAYVSQGDAGAGIGRILRAVMTNFEDMTIYVTDARGGFIFSTGRQAATAPTVGVTLLPADYFAVISGEASTADETDHDGVIGRYAATDTPIPSDTDAVFFEASFFRDRGEELVCAAPVVLADGTVLGHVAVSSAAEARAYLIDTTMTSVAVAGLWVMLAALIAIYFITERIIGPLREMSRAARKLMVGQFDVRVRVHGKDEVAELAAAFNQMAGSLESLDQMRNSFVANVSHDLRTPMTTIAGFIDGILDGVIPPEEHAHYLHVVSDEVRRLSRLVTALLDVSRLQAGDRTFDMQPFDICEMGRQILISFEQKIDDRHLDVEFLCEEERMYVLADRDAIHQILYNICDNAIKFAYEGGKLRMSFAWSPAGGHRGRKAYVTVYNEGPGIPPEDMPYVFERFYKSDKSRSLDKSGVGLGMFIAKTIIDAHHETISVSGEYGRDCAFTFTLAQSDPPLKRCGGSMIKEDIHE